MAFLRILKVDYLSSSIQEIEIQFLWLIFEILNNFVLRVKFETEFQKRISIPFFQFLRLWLNSPSLFNALFY